MVNYKEEGGSQQDLLMLKEYGRNIQKLVDFLLTVEDKEKRTKQAYTLVELMKQISGNTKEDVDQKMWNHMHIMADFKLDVDGPYPKPPEDTLERKPDKIEYQLNNLKFRHYGKNVELLAKQIADMPEGEEKKNATIYLSRLMKRFYLTWNKENVEDELILSHVGKLSGDVLKLDPKEVTEKGILNVSSMSKSYGNSSGNNSGKSGGGRSNKNNNRKGSNKGKRKRY